MKKLLKYIGKQIKDCDKILLILSIFYAILGIFLILSASSISSKLNNGTPFYYFEKQIYTFVISLVIGLIIMCFFPTRTYQFIGKWGGIALTFVVLLIMLNNKTINIGNEEVTLDLGFTTIQPGEFIKIILIMFLGCSYYNLSQKEKKNKIDYLIPPLLCIPSIAFIFFGGDKGSAVIICVIVALMFVFVPTKEKEFKITKIIVVTLLIVFFFGLKYAYLLVDDSNSNNYVLSRLNYVNPCDRYTSNSGYQVCNGFIAIDNGGLWGVGIGNSIQKYLYLPASHTDFIFAIIVEELGVIVSSIIILGYVVIAYRIFDTSVKSYNLRNSLICFGIGIYFLLHIFVNLGGVLGLIPLTGIPLPLLSYGGSSLLAMFSAFAIVQKISIENKLTKRKKEIKKLTGE